jgi:pyruvate dehydrogenase E2 component (dihydrolipoamide acetyltransferase)
MPSLGADMDFGTLVRWHVKPGDVVSRGDVVGEVETQKGVFGVDIREDGVIEELLVPEGTRVPVGTLLARIAARGTAAPPVARAPQQAPEPMLAHAARPSEDRGGVRVASRRGPRASPLARRIAEERGVDLAQVKGTGTGGVITRADVERAVAAPEQRAAPSPPAPVPPSTAVPEKAQAMRAAIAAAMTRSKREIPHYYLSEEMDLGPALGWLADANAARPVADRILPAALLLKAVARAVADFPEFNGHFADGTFHASEAVHLGVAIALRGGGLVAPALHDASRLGVDALMRALLDLVARARAGQLRTSEFTDPTITVTSLGDAGTQMVLGVIYPPQVAIIGFGAVAERPWAAEGMLGVRPTVTASLAADHRVSDGHRGALLLGTIHRLLQVPEAL